MLVRGYQLNVPPVRGKRFQDMPAVYEGRPCLSPAVSRADMETCKGHEGTKVELLQ